MLRGELHARIIPERGLVCKPFENIVEAPLEQFPRHTGEKSPVEYCLSSEEKIPAALREDFLPLLDGHRTIILCRALGCKRKLRKKFGTKFGVHFDVNP